MAILCLVTDRRQLGAADDAVACERLLAQVRAAAQAGVDLVQIRERDLPARRLFELAEAAVATTRGTATRLLINDRLDVALAARADGVHLGGRSCPAERLRPLVPAGFLIGRSVHDAAEAAEVASAGAIDYLIAGTVFPSPSKPGLTAWLGPAGLEEVVRAVQVPVLAIGGITVATLPLAGRTGAAGAAAIGLYLPGAASPATVGSGEAPGVSSLDAVVAEARRAFDSLRTIP